MFFSPSQNRRKHWYHILRIEKRLLWIPAVFVAVGFVVCLVLLFIYALRAREFDMNQVAQSLPSSMLYDRANRPVSPLGRKNNAPVSWEELPHHLVNAFLAREDEHFFEHNGVVYSALARSVLRNLWSMSYKEGASTITMQLTRHVFELSGKTLDRKMLEIMLAQRVEKAYDKKSILCQYLSRIYFGQNCYGLRDAARFFFDKDVRELDLAESAMLAGIVRAPSLFNPVRNPKYATAARRETLSRMLELGMISMDDFEAANQVPVPRKQRGIISDSAAARNYPALWVNAELDSLEVEEEERSHGLAVVSHLILPLQQYAERSLATVIRAVENPKAPLPASWAKEPGAEPGELQAKLFTGTKRPAGLRSRPGQLGADECRVQACLLVVDSRLNHRGNILAVTCGRSAADPANHWLSEIRPGRAAAPLIFCSACLPGSQDNHIVAHSARVTGSGLGYDVVYHFLSALNLGKLPDREHENDLYDGLFPMRKIDLARTLFDIQNMGQDYELKLISAVWSQGHHLIYSAGNKKASEYIRREGAVAVSHLPPFRYREGVPTILNEDLPADSGHWTMVFNERGVAVFVWMGLEMGSAAEPPSPEFRRLMAQASLALARRLHSRARKELRESNKSVPNQLNAQSKAVTSSRDNTEAIKYEVRSTRYEVANLWRAACGAEGGEMWSSVCSGGGRRGDFPRILWGQLPERTSSAPKMNQSTQAADTNAHILKNE